MADLNNTGGDLLSSLGSIIPGVGGVISLLGGLFSSSKSPQEQAYENVLSMIKQGKLGQEAYTKGEIESIVNDLQTMYRGAASLSAARVGQAIGESDVAGGQGYADYYLSNIAPILAQGEAGAAEAEKFGVQAYSSIHGQAQNEIASALGLATQASAGLSNMTGTQKGIAGFLQTLNLLSQAGGNIANLYTGLNKQYPTGVRNGQISYGG